MRRMLLLLLCLFVACLSHSQKENEPTKHAGPPGTNSYYTTETARVEQVFRVVDDGFQYVAYQISWHGEHVIVSDPLTESAHVVGDEVRFMADRIETPSSPKPLKNIAFILLESRKHQKAEGK
jgi:hypothetical protein